MYKIADKFKNTKVFYFQSTFNNHVDFSHCKSLEEAAQEIADDVDMYNQEVAKHLGININDYLDFLSHKSMSIYRNSRLKHAYDTLNKKTQEEVINDAENLCDYVFALGYVEEIKDE